MLSSAKKNLASASLAVLIAVGEEEGAAASREVMPDDVAAEETMRARHIPAALVATFGRAASQEPVDQAAWVGCGWGRES